MPIKVHIGTQSTILTQRNWQDAADWEREAAEMVVAGHIMRIHPLGHTSKVAAEAEIEAIASNLDDAEGLLADLGVALGSVPGPGAVPLEHRGLVLEIELGDLVRIATTHEVTRQRHLEFHSKEESSPKEPEVQALCLPHEFEDGPCLRLVARKSLFGFFRLVGTTIVPARSGRRAM
ncbi:MAG TPA: hypothetical protein VGF95_10400 [Solirubrobacteraceae bacterium]|jgi:hypothetical protein